MEEDRELIKIIKGVILWNLLLKFLSFVGTTTFIIAKLSNWINWSWWWILVPIVLPAFYEVSYRSRKRED